MASLTATRRIQFCAGHRVYGHESKCSNLHGHNYVALIEAKALDGLDHVGRVIDFSVLKSEVGSWIDRNWDHGMILWAEDFEAIRAVSSCKDDRNGGSKMFLLPSNPTAENMAGYLLNTVCPMLFAQFSIQVTSVVLWETENCFARAEL